MKKLKISLLLMFVTLIMGTTVFTSCNKDDSSGAKSILMNHKWEVSTIETEDEVVKQFFDFTFNLVTTTYQFKKDGTYTVTMKVIFVAAEEEEGTWSMSDDGKELTIDGDTSEIIELTNKVLRTGPNAAIMGSSSDDFDESADYVLVFEAK